MWGLASGSTEVNALFCLILHIFRICHNNSIKIITWGTFKKLTAAPVIGVIGLGCSTDIVFVCFKPPWVFLISFCVRIAGIGSPRPLGGFGILLWVRKGVRMLGSRMTPSDCDLKPVTLAAGLGINCRETRAGAKRSRRLQPRAMTKQVRAGTDRQHTEG